MKKRKSNQKNLSPQKRQNTRGGVLSELPKDWTITKPNTDFWDAST